MMPQCSGLKKQKADASLIKTIKLAAAPSAIVRDQGNEWKKAEKWNSEGSSEQLILKVWSKALKTCKIMTVKTG